MWALDDSIPAASGKEAPRTGLSEDPGLELPTYPPPATALPHFRSKGVTHWSSTRWPRRRMWWPHIPSQPFLPGCQGQHYALLMRTREEGGAPTCGLSATELPPGFRGG